MRGWICCTVVLGSLAVAHSPAWAGSYEQVRQGYWWGFGLSYGSAHASSDDATDFAFATRSGALGSYVRFGGTVGEKTLLGCEVNGVTKTTEVGTTTIGNISAVLYYYPARRSGFFVKGGAGLGVAVVDLKDDDNNVSGVGAGLTLGIGYDYRIGARTSLTPTLTYYAGWPGQLEYDGSTVATGFKHNVLEFGLGITRH
jgi:hypothetical protein